MWYESFNNLICWWCLMSKGTSNFAYHKYVVFCLWFYKKAPYKSTKAMLLANYGLHRRVRLLHIASIIAHICLIPLRWISFFSYLRLSYSWYRDRCLIIGGHCISNQHITGLSLLWTWSKNLSVCQQMTWSIRRNLML